MSTQNNNIEEFIRDVTKVGSIPKSEVRRRLNEIISFHTDDMVEGLKGLLDKGDYNDMRWPEATRNEVDGWNKALDTAIEIIRNNIKK